MTPDAFTQGAQDDALLPPPSPAASRAAARQCRSAGTEAGAPAPDEFPQETREKFRSVAGRKTSTDKKGGTTAA